ncbi:cytochrome c [Arenibaculum sp.]|jgi:cytochrome c556|uniref:c-type cytochrome n=1 Tax=Arenibaculum sp. TaxID=2865862 RepID=UPI002E0E9BF6|nr:cytochrome c [Arenibaculum sp.]
MLRIGTITIGSLIAAAIAFGAHAQSPQPTSQDPSEQIAQREAAMKEMGGAMKTISAYVKNEGGTIEDVREGAATIDLVSASIVPHLFPAGTEAGVGSSDALPAIWDDWSGFEQAAGALTTASAELTAAAESGDRAAIAAAFAATGRSCGGCHETYRAEK